MTSRFILGISLSAGLLLAPWGHAYDPIKAPIESPGSLQALFTPWDDVERNIVEIIGGAQQQILVQTYLLTSKKITRALIAAHQRGVEVLVLVDFDQYTKVADSKIRELAAEGIKVWLETKYKNAHNKIIVIDAASPDSTVITGSYNFTWSAQQKNAENILIVRKNRQLAEQYAANWLRHQQDALIYKK